jgi:hypothetical protein
MSIRAHFHVSDKVNKQNCHYWDPNNPHELHQHPLHSAKVTVWCEVYSYGISGPYFFENTKGHTVTLNAEWFRFMLEIFLCIELQQQDLLWFQHDGATAHTEEISMQVLRTVFLGKLISLFGDITSLTCSPDHGLPD